MDAEKNWAARVGTALRRKKFKNYYNFFPPNANSTIWPSTRPKLNTVQHSELKFTGVGGHICGKKPQKVNCSDFSPTHLCGLHGHSPSKQMRLPLHFPGVSLPAHELISDCRSLWCSYRNNSLFASKKNIKVGTLGQQGASVVVIQSVCFLWSLPSVKHFTIHI